MIRKVLKTLIVVGVWTVLYLFVTRFLFVSLVGWDYLSPLDWQRIEYRWNSGAAIKSFHDYMVLFALLMLVPVWFFGCKYWYRVNYINVLLFPFKLANKIMLRRYSSGNKRIVLRNIGTGMKVEEEIKLKTAAIKPQERNEADKIRNAVSKKIRDEQKINDN